MDVVRTVFAILCLSLLLSAGCSGPSDRPELAKVTGYVTLDGEPLERALVLFGPEKGRSSFAYTDENGYFELMYLADTPGAIIGTHTVSISSGYEEEEEPPPGAEPYVDPIPEIYNTKTTLSAVVKADEKNEFTFHLKSQ